MMVRMSVARCCCNVESDTQFLTNRGWDSFRGWYDAGPGPGSDDDPITYTVVGAQGSLNLYWGSVYRSGVLMYVGGNIGAVGEPIPVATYTNFRVAMKGFSANNDGTYSSTDGEQSDYDVYVVNQTGAGATYISNARTNGVPRSSLLGPVTWSAGTEDWSDFPYLKRFTPDISTHVNTVVNDAAWSDSSGLVLWVEPKSKDNESTPEGRQWGDLGANSNVWVEATPAV